MPSTWRQREFTGLGFGGEFRVCFANTSCLLHFPFADFGGFGDLGPRALGRLDRGGRGVLYDLFPTRFHFSNGRGSLRLLTSHQPTFQFGGGISDHSALVVGQVAPGREESRLSNSRELQNHRPMPQRIPVVFLPERLAVTAAEARAMLGDMPVRTFATLVGRGLIKKLCRNRYSVEQIRQFVATETGLAVTEVRSYPPNRQASLSDQLLVRSHEARALLGNLSATAFYRLTGRGLIKKLCRNRYSVDQIRRYVEQETSL